MNSTIYTTLYEIDWQRGLDPRAGVQANPGGIELVSDPADAARSANAARKVLRAHIDRGERYAGIANGVPRAELLFPAPVRFQQNRDYLIRWSTWLPADFAFDSRQLMIIAQVNQGKWTGAPTLALALLGERYALSVHGGAKHDTVSAGKWLCCANADRGRWVHWAIHYVPDETGQHALTELYKDGVQVFAAHGAPNAYPGVNDAYLKLGLYKRKWDMAPSDVDTSTVLYGPLSVSIAVSVARR
ncbi:heparin lyase I family protein [Paraburkholderia sp. SARCC-3016]|uniref:heparin lyase I family protein n=1 Tax=Paraburkholderia sp. SARCC-3016 TaxID=3058611 RepID=UPI0028075FF3|nr:heparin lyase I family protein [Paraburkholderia sp. SARCC-3016]MDQ7980499.1 heparin lyase I family protein [Paraburkholderia sp. SARCC-3016]